MFQCHYYHQRVIKMQTSLTDPHYKITEDAITDKSWLTLDYNDWDMDVWPSNEYSQQHAWIDIVHLLVADSFEQLVPWIQMDNRAKIGQTLITKMHEPDNTSSVLLVPLQIRTGLISKLYAYSDNWQSKCSFSTSLLDHIIQFGTQCKSTSFFKFQIYTQ